MEYEYLLKPYPSCSTLLVILTSSWGGLKKTIKLEVREAFVVVTPEEVSERPGIPVNDGAPGASIRVKLMGPVIA